MKALKISYAVFMWISFWFAFMFVAVMTGSPIVLGLSIPVTAMLNMLALMLAIDGEL